VRADGYLAERRSADDQGATGELEQVRQVRGPVRELAYRDERAKIVEMRLEVAGEPAPVELVARPDGGILGRVVLRLARRG
jgi:hypothetical protein